MCTVVCTTLTLAETLANICLIVNLDRNNHSNIPSKIEHNCFQIRNLTVQTTILMRICAYAYITYKRMHMHICHVCVYKCFVQTELSITMPTWPKPCMHVHARCGASTRCRRRRRQLITPRREAPSEVRYESSYTRTHMHTLTHTLARTRTRTRIPKTHTHSHTHRMFVKVN